MTIRLDSPDDPRHDELYRVVGRVVVAGGHCERAMQDVWLLLSGQGVSARPRAAGFRWSTLVKKILGLAAEQGRDDVLAVMQWAEDSRLKTIRDDVVHGRLSLGTAQTGVWMDRIYQDGRRVTIVGDEGDLGSTAVLLFEFADRLRLIATA